MLDDMLSKKGVSVDKVLDFQITDQVLVERIEGQGLSLNSPPVSKAPLTHRCLTV